METQILLFVAGALIGAIATYLYNRKSYTTLKDELYDKQLVNKFLREYCQKNKSKRHGKRKYYKKQHATKAGNKTNQSSK